MPKIFPSVYKNFKETYNSKNWSAKRSYCLGKCSVDRPAETFLAVSKTDKKTYTFFEKSFFCFSSLRSYGHEEYGDYNLAEELSTKGRNCFAQSTKMVKKYIF